MREGIKTSLLSILCVATAAAANAAPTVRTIGGTGTYESVAAANDTASSRAGSLRSTGGFVRPTATLSTSGGASVSSPKSVTTTTTTSGGSVATGGGTAGRVASTPRLSIGKYVGAPKSISSSGGTSSDLTSRIAKLESDVNGLEQDKQDNLQDSTYIYIDHNNNEVVLNLDAVRDALGINTDREIDFKDDETGLYWHYVDEGEETWHEIFTWSELAGHLTSEIESIVSDKITELRTELDARYVLVNQGTTDNQGNSIVGKAMVINDEGYLVPTDVTVDTTGLVTADQLDSALDDYVTIYQGTGDNDELVGTTMVIDSEGNLQPGGTFVTPGQLDSALDSALDDYVLVHQGIGENGADIGKAMVINDDGDLVPTDLGDTYVTIQQGTGEDDENVGKVMAIDENGNLTPTDITEGFATTDDVDNLIDNYNLADVKWVTKWQEWWLDNKPSDDENYIMSVDQYGNRTWYKIVTAEDAVVGDPDPDPDPDNP